MPPQIAADLLQVRVCAGLRRNAYQAPALLQRNKM
jgi:hypothetical protein